MRNHSKLVQAIGIMVMCIFFAIPPVFSTFAESEQNVQVMRNISCMTLALTENRGQWDEKVLFRADAGGAAMWFTKDGAVYQFTRKIYKGDGGFDAPMLHLGRDYLQNEPDGIESIAIKASIVGANPNPRVIGADIMGYKCNYFIGNDPNNWHTDVSSYSAIIYEEIYSGIDLKYYGNGKQMEYDFIVSPGADPSQIAIRYDGAKSISVNDNGELVVKTIWSEVIEQRPIVYQIQDSAKEPIEGEYLIINNNSFGFSLGDNYNPALPLVIDPVLSYSTYLGGSGGDKGNAITVDGSGNAYIAGVTTSSDFPTEGEYQTAQGESDVFVTKLNSTGNDLVYSTYLGGSLNDHCGGISVDGAGNAFIAGLTTSSDFPTEGEYQTDQGNNDVFVTKLNSTGNDLVYSTYLGGSLNDHCGGISVDGAGNAFVTGFTYSSDFPIEGEYQTAQGESDVFVTKLNSSGNDLVYSTYLGGSDNDRGYGISIDGSGNAYLAGWTASTDFPTEGEYQADPGDDHIDAFVTKLNSSGNVLTYSTYLGGSHDDYGYGVSVDDSGNAYITGNTVSSDFPTMGEYQTHQGATDVFVTKLNSSGNDLVYSTYLGGSSGDAGIDIFVNGSGNAHVVGVTISTDFPIEEEYQTSQGGNDVFVTKLNSSGNDLVYSTYLGGVSDEAGIGICVDDYDKAYITGYTGSSNFPTREEYQTNQGYDDAFVTKISEADDADSDGIADAEDNCPYNFNPDQTDTDGDLIGDVCDPDDDNDGVFDILDSDQLDPSACTDSDNDGCDDCAVGTDGFGPLPDNDPYNDGTDTDSDGICDLGDNCPDDYNPDQADSDGNNIGDACDNCCLDHGTPGDANDDLLINLLDILHIISYVYQDPVGDPPNPHGCDALMDCNGDGDSAMEPVINLLDILAMIEHIYQNPVGDPAMCCPPDCQVP